MSLDGMLLRHLCVELREKIIGLRINKIYQPAKHEINLVLRGQGNVYKLVISASADAPRIGLTEQDIKNPESPPAFCMLLRKKILSSKVTEIEQKALERVICIKLQSRDDMGNEIYYKLLVEIMGKHSNIILIKDDGKIIDAIKRITAEISSKRTVIPGAIYFEPPSQGKLCILDVRKEEILKKIFFSEINDEEHMQKTFRSAVLSALQGASGAVCDWLAEKIGCSGDIKLFEMSPFMKENLSNHLLELTEIVKNAEGLPYIIKNRDSKTDISFLEIKNTSCEKYGSFSQLIDTYYSEKTAQERQNSKVGALFKKIEHLILSRKKKISIQEEEIKKCEGKEKFKLFGDLLTSNIYKIKKGMEKIEVENFFSDTSETVKIPLDKMLGGAENAQRYYKKYKKQGNAQKALTIQIENAKNDINYLENVLDSLNRCESENEIREIRAELGEQGYIRFKSKSKLKVRSKALSFIEFASPSGYKILIGRNCRQNEKLTYKMAGRRDMWFHVKDMPGSHTVMLTGGQDVKDEDIVFAGKLCAQHSSARDLSNVPVDYTFIYNVKKPNGYRPGMAVYKEYKTIYVTPNKRNV